MCCLRRSSVCTLPSIGTEDECGNMFKKHNEHVSWHCRQSLQYLGTNYCICCNAQTAIITYIEIHENIDFQCWNSLRTIVAYVAMHGHLWLPTVPTLQYSTQTTIDLLFWNSLKQGLPTFQCTDNNNCLCWNSLATRVAYVTIHRQQWSPTYVAIHRLH